MTDYVNHQVESSTPSDQQQRKPDGEKIDDVAPGASIPMGRRGRVPPNILVGGDSNDDVPPNNLAN